MYMYVSAYVIQHVWGQRKMLIGSLHLLKLSRLVNL